MVDAISSAASGMQYASQALNSTAAQISTMDSAIDAGVSAPASSGGGSSDASSPSAQGVDLSTLIPGLGLAKVAMEANVAVMKQANAMYSSILQLLPGASAPVKN